MGETQAEPFSFGEKELQTCLNRMRVYKSPDDALEPWLGLEDDKVHFLGIPTTEKTAQTILALKGNEKKPGGTVLAYVVVDEDSEKAINLLDILPPEENWKVIYDPDNYAPEVKSNKTIIINELPQFNFLGKTIAAVPLIMVAGHEIGHAVKTEEEKFLTLKLFKGLSLKELVPVILLAVSGRLLAPLLRYSQGSQKFHKLDAKHDRKASAISFQVIRKMRELGVDPLPGMTDKEIVAIFHQKLEGKDWSSTVGKVYSHY